MQAATAAQSVETAAGRRPDPVKPGIDMFLLLKIPLVIAVAALWIKTESILLPSFVWGLAVLFVGVLFNGLSFAVFLNAVLSTLVCVGIFYLLQRTFGTGYQAVVGILGAGLLLFVV